MNNITRWNKRVSVIIRGIRFTFPTLSEAVTLLREMNDNPA